MFYKSLLINFDYSKKLFIYLEIMFKAFWMINLKPLFKKFNDRMLI